MQASRFIMTGTAPAAIIPATPGSFSVRSNAPAIVRPSRMTPSFITRKVRLGRKYPASQIARTCFRSSSSGPRK